MELDHPNKITDQLDLHNSSNGIPTSDVIKSDLRVSEIIDILILFF